MQKNNGLFAKAEQINLCGVIGMALALIGLLLPSIRVSFMGMGESGTMFQMTMWTILPLILIVGTCALYALKFDTLGFLASLLSALVYFIVIICCKAEGKSQLGGYSSSVGIHFTFGFYLAFLGFMIAIAAPWINKLIFKMQPKQPKQQFDPNMPQGYGMDRQNPYMGQGQPGQGNPFMQQNAPYMQQGQPGQGNPYMQQGNPYMQQGNPYLNQPQNQPNPYAGQPNPYMGQTNPYLQQAQDQAGQAAEQFNQFAQNADNNNEQQ